MTNREKAIVSAYTGTCMLLGSDIKYFDEYLEELFGQEYLSLNKVILFKDIKEKSEHDFFMLCAEEEKE